MRVDDGVEWDVLYMAVFVAGLREIVSHRRTPLDSKSTNRSPPRRYSHLVGGEALEIPETKTEHCRPSPPPTLGAVAGSRESMER